MFCIHEAPQGGLIQLDNDHLANTPGPSPKAKALNLPFGQLKVGESIRVPTRLVNAHHLRKITRGYQEHMNTRHKPQPPLKLRVRNDGPDYTRVWRIQ